LSFFPYPTKKIFDLFVYQPVVLSHLEEKGLFAKGVGEMTDITQRQMFKIESKDIVLRPEATAQIARLYIEKNLYKYGDFHKFYYIGSMFRGERPQRGRLREFHHIGAEAIGSDSCYLDAEIIDVALRIIKDCGIDNVTLKINSLGCPEDKYRLSQQIQKKLMGYHDDLCEVCKNRLGRSPLRILDCKNPICKKIVFSLAIGMSHLCPQCFQHFHNLQILLDEAGIEYKYDELLVRGLDYYTKTVFEITSSDLGAQDAIGAGGRYNHLIKNLGGPDTPAVGFALGVERMMILLSRGDNDFVLNPSSTRIVVAYTSELIYKDAWRIVKLLRDNDICCGIDYKNKSLKSQLKFAQKINVSWVIIVADEELKNNCIIVRDMVKSTQEKISIKMLVEYIKEKKLIAGK